MWKYRSPSTDSGSLRSGLESRLFSAVRLSFPPYRAQRAVLQIFAIHVFLAYPVPLQLRLLRKHAHLFPIVYSSIFDSVRRAVHQGGPGGAISLIELISTL